MADLNETPRFAKVLLRNLASLEVDESGAIDFQGSDPDVLVVLAECSEGLARATALGLGAIGVLLNNFGGIEKQEGLSSYQLPALGQLMAELGDLLDECHALATRSRAETFDYAPPQTNAGPDAVGGGHDEG